MGKIKKILSALAILSLLLVGCANLEISKPSPEANRTAPEELRYSVFDHIPGFASAEQNIASIYEVEQVSAYFEEFLIQWDVHHLDPSSEKIRKVFDKIELNWQDQPFHSDDITKYPVLIGLTEVRIEEENKVIVFAYNAGLHKDPKLGDTCLGHELIHVALYATTGHSHSDHFKNELTVFPRKYEKFKEDVNAKFK